MRGRVAMAMGAGWLAAFEVASVKASTTPAPGVRRRVGCDGGPERGDPGLLTCTNMSSINLVTAGDEHGTAAPD